MTISVTGLSGLMNRSIKLTCEKANGFLCLPASDDAPNGRMIGGTREYTKLPIAALDPNGNLFYSIPHDAFWKIPEGFSHFLTNGNPIILTEVVGNNPRFYPITVI